MRSSARLLCLFLLCCLALTGCGGGCKKSDDADAFARSLQIPDPLGETEPLDAVDYRELVLQQFRDLSPAPASDFSCQVTGDTVTVTKYNGSEPHLRIPSQIEGKNVTALAQDCFAGATFLTVLMIPDSVESIGKDLLADCSDLYALQTPVLGEYLGYLFGAEDYRRNNVSPMRNLDFLSFCGNATALPAHYLYDCNDLRAVVLPDGMTVLGEFSLYLCEDLSYVNTEHLVSVAPYALGNCSSLQSLTFGEKLNEIGLGSLQHTDSLQTLTLPFIGENRQSNRYLGYLFGASDVAFSKGFYPKGLTDLTLLAGCTELAGNALFECSSLRNLTLPEGVTSLGIRALSGCQGLTALDLPDSVTSIGDNCFAGCLRLKSCTLSDGLTSIGIQAFLNCLSLEDVQISEGVAVIPSSCFANCISLQSVSLCNVKTVDPQAFRNCIALVRISANSKVKFGKGNDKAEALLLKK